MREKGLALPRASHSGEIALAGSHRLRSTLAAAPVFLHTLLSEAIKISRMITSCAFACSFECIHAGAVHDVQRVSTELWYRASVLAVSSMSVFMSGR